MPGLDKPSYLGMTGQNLPVLYLPGTYLPTYDAYAGLVTDSGKSLSLRSMGEPRFVVARCCSS